MDQSVDDKKVVESWSCPVRGFISGLIAKRVTFHEGSSPGTSNFDSNAEYGEVLMNSDSDDFIEDQSTLLSLQPWIFKKEVRREQVSNCYVNDLETEFSTRGKRSRNSSRTRKLSYYVKPFAPVDTCFIPHIYGDYKVEEYVYTTIPSSAEPVLKPLLITDGNTIINKSVDSNSVMSVKSKLHEVVSDRNSEGKRITARKIEQNSRTQHERWKASSSSMSREFCPSEDLLEGVLLFCLGIALGVMFTMLSNRREVEKLNNMLRQTENFVQDLQDELDMKDLFVVKELANESLNEQVGIVNSVCPSKNCNSPVISSPTNTVTYVQRNSSKLPENHSSGNSESLTSMEAELEAELEILEQSMCTSLERRTSIMSEIYPDFIADIVDGELREDMFEVQEIDSSGDGDSCTTYVAMNENQYYAVSPRELSLRLHEILRSQLEERVADLEAELYRSRQNLNVRSLTNSDAGSFCTAESTLCLDLSGDALNAYNEAYAEFMQITETKDERPHLSLANMMEKIDRQTSCSHEETYTWSSENSIEN